MASQDCQMMMMATSPSYIERGRSFKCEANMQSNWKRHLNQSKSIRLRSRQVTSARNRKSCKHQHTEEEEEEEEEATGSPAGLKRVEQNNATRPATEALETATVKDDGRERVPINQERQQRHEQKQANTSDNQRMISSPMKPNYSRLQIAPRCGFSFLKTASRNRLAQVHTPPLFWTVVLLAGLVLLANGPVSKCLCDNNGNLLSRSSTSRATTKRLPTQGIASTKSHKESALNSLSASIERQHLGGSLPASSSPSKFDSGADKSGRRSSVTRHDDFLREILASHEQRVKPTNKASSGSTNNRSAYFKSSPSSSKAEQDLRQIMLMHEHAPHASGPSVKHQGHLDDLFAIGSQSGTNKKRSKTKVLASLKSLVARAAPGEKKTATEVAQQQTITNLTGSLFTPRANAKNHLIGPLMGLSQKLLTQTPTRPMLASLNPSTGSNSAQQMDLHNQTVYLQPANSFTPKKRNSKTTSAKKLTTSSTQLDSIMSDDSATEASSVLLSSSTLGDNTTKESTNKNNKTPAKRAPTATVGGWIKNGASQLAQSYFQDSLRDLLTLSQLPILSGGPISTAPSDLEPGGRKWLANKVAAEQTRGNRTQTLEDLLRYVYIFGNVGVRRKRDPLKVLGSSTAATNTLMLSTSSAVHSNRRPLRLGGALQPISSLIKLPLTASKLSSMLAPNRNIRPRGVMWDMATDPSLAVTVFHLLERASVALPLGFLLMPVVHMIRNPLNGINGLNLNNINLGRILPARASHRSVDYEELVKRLDMMDKILSRAMRPTHREAHSPFMGR